jgi:hypothetical protein
VFGAALRTRLLSRLSDQYFVRESVFLCMRARVCVYVCICACLCAGVTEFSNYEREILILKKVGRSLTPLEDICN